MKTPLNRRQWRGVAGRLYHLSDQFYAVSDEIRYANKPADLSYPISRLLVLVQKTQYEQKEWLEKLLKLNPEDRGLWPHL